MATAAREAESLATPEAQLPEATEAQPPEATEAQPPEAPEAQPPEAPEAQPPEALAAEAPITTAPRAPVHCPACGVLLPPDPHQNAFERLGLAPRFAQSAGAVDAARRARLLAVHPDRYAPREPTERALALAWATAINDAGRTLQEGFDRAQHLITLRQADAFPARIRDADWQRLFELKQVLRELDGVDAHVERSRLTRLVVAEYEQGLSDLGSALDAGEAPASALAPRLAWLRSLRSVVEALQS